MQDGQALHESVFTLKDAAAVRGRFLALGLLNVLAGFAVVILPRTLDAPPPVVIGGVLLLIGAADAYHAIQLSTKRGCMLGWISSCLFLLMGVLLLFSPLAHFSSLYLAIALMFVFAGMLRIGKGLDIRPVNNWSWVIASGMLSVILGLVVFDQGQPMNFDLVGMLLGIGLLVDGWSRMILFWVHE